MLARRACFVCIALALSYRPAGGAAALQDAARLTVVISDLHMGVGRTATGAWQPTEDFRWADEFARFLEAIGRVGNDAVDLVLDGDTFELTGSRPSECRGGSDDAGCSAAEVRARLDTVVKAHDAEMSALGRFARAGSNRVVFVPGDEDAGLLFPDVAARVVNALGTPRGRAEVATAGYWVSSDGQVYADHGHQVGFSAHRFDRWPTPYVERGGVRRLERPWGERLARGLFDRYEAQAPIVDNVAVLGTGLRYMVSADEASAADVVPQLLRYLMFAVAWQQFRMELDDGGVQPPTWDLAQVRAQGPAFLVASLPDDDRLKPLAAKALADQRLNDVLPSDQELIAICDYRAAVRRSRRRLEPTLSQLAPRGPALSECPRTRETRGAAFEYFWRSRDEVFLRYLDSIKTRVPRTGRELAVYVHGHTHLPDRGQTSANMISGGMLTIPMEGFSPVRGKLSPVVINAGAWQRTITPVQLERRATEAGVSVEDLVRRMTPDDLPPCYSLVQVTSTGGTVVPAVRYWRRTPAGDWGMAASCGGDSLQ
jgi:hypothetical protein